MTDANSEDNTVNHHSKITRIPTHAEAQANPQELAEFNAAVLDEFRLNEGKVGGPFADSDVVIVTITGARSGRRRETPLEYFIVDGRILIVGTKGGAPRNPAWVHNLRANPAVHMEIGTESYDAVAQEITGAERDEMFVAVSRLSSRVATYPKPERLIPLFELRRT